MSHQPVNLLVFREGRRDVAIGNLTDHLAGRLRQWTSEPRQDEILALTLLAGELECGFADAFAADALSIHSQSDAIATLTPAVNPTSFDLKNPPGLPAQLAELTDTLARLLVGEDLLEAKREINRLAETLETVRMPGLISVSAPEGFAYYALHPLAYADVLNKLSDLSGTVAVIGIRSIGTTLSGVVVAAARGKGMNANRITVRPQGHPYNRELRLSPAELEFVERSRLAGADFLIVDEGPGLSGSSFLGVAEALVSAGVPREKITLLCGHQPDLDSLRANNAPQRARQFRWLAVDNEAKLPPTLLEETHHFLGGGEWRRLLLPDPSVWPASWTSFERLKYQSSNTNHDSRLFKFLGFGHYGHAVFAREQRLADAGFGPQIKLETNGFASYPWISGRPMRPNDLNARVLARLAEYCAFRAAAFPSGLADLESLQQMADHNLRELGFSEPGFHSPVQLDLRHPIIADGRMQPHEWLLTADGTMLKTDSGSHGDDHFFPGPTDIAWDLAGAMVEWEMSADQSAMFLDLYREKTADNAASRIPSFVIAYSVFRTAYCRMAANALGEGEESSRFHDAAEKYKRAICEYSRSQILKNCCGAQPPSAALAFRGR